MLRRKSNVPGNVVVEQKQDKSGCQGIGDQKALEQIAFEDAKPRPDQGGREEADGDDPEMDEDRPVEVHTGV